MPRYKLNFIDKVVWGMSNFAIGGVTKYNVFIVKNLGLKLSSLFWFLILQRILWEKYNLLETPLISGFWSNFVLSALLWGVFEIICHSESAISESELNGYERWLYTVIGVIASPLGWIMPIWLI